LIKELNTQIGLTQEAIDRAKNSPSQEVASGSNPTFQNVEDSYIHANAAHSGSLAEASSLSAEIGADRKKLAQMSAVTASYDDLVRHRDELIKLREGYRKSRDEAYIDVSLDKQKLSNVAVVESPVAERLTASPRRGVILGVGFVWSLLASLVTAFLLELSSPRVYSSFELEQAIIVPLLAAVPHNAPLSYVSEEFPELYLAMQRTVFIPETILET
jgi:uncharacterized protein involved in exopolysaccharide biosynthesis